MKLIGYIFDKNNRKIRISDGLTPEQYQDIWNMLQIGNESIQ